MSVVEPGEYFTRARNMYQKVGLATMVDLV
jgi:hypothetical protein